MVGGGPMGGQSLLPHVRQLTIRKWHSQAAIVTRAPTAELTPSDLHILTISLKKTTRLE